MTSKLNIVIPAFNEELGIEKTIQRIPFENLVKLGYDTEVIVVDNGSTDKTADKAKALGAKVVYEKNKGYGNAYKTGFANVNGEFVATCDADGTYPVEAIPQLVTKLTENKLDFLTTNRFSQGYVHLASMPLISRVGNLILSGLFKVLYGLKLKDSQSGMWVFRSEILKNIKVKSGQMAFSQELKIDAICYAKCKWCEEEIVYYERLGDKKLKPLADGINNALHLFKKRLIR